MPGTDPSEGPPFLRERRWFEMVEDGRPGRHEIPDDDDVYYSTVLYSLETKARRGDGEYGRLYEGAEQAEGRNSRGTQGHSLH